jgi:hypothetical protein
MSDEYKAVTVQVPNCDLTLREITSTETGRPYLYVFENSGGRLDLKPADMRVLVTILGSIVESFDIVRQ